MGSIVYRGQLTAGIQAVTPPSSHNFLQRAYLISGPTHRYLVYPQIKYQTSTLVACPAGVVYVVARDPVPYLTVLGSRKQIRTGWDSARQRLW